MSPAVYTAWHDVMIASSAAAATLAGLILAAMSVNISAILKYPALPPRAGSAIGELIYVLLLTLSALIPDVGNTALGWLTLIVLVGPVLIHVDVMVRQFQILIFPRFSGRVDVVVRPRVRGLTG